MMKPDLLPVRSWSSLILIALAFGGCSSSPEARRSAAISEQLADVESPAFVPQQLDRVLAYLDDRGAWDDHGRPLMVPRHPAEKYLEGLVVVLDPGHGGKGDVPGYKMGPTGVREAEMNLRVAHLLRRLLEDAGAQVTLTREGEVSEVADDRLADTLRRRAEVANTCPRPDGGVGADLFISLHHNASDRADANYPSVWFHGEADWAEPALDAAKYVGHRLGAELRCEEVGLTSVLMSDRQMYRSGFGVLRHCRVPAFLVEASFFSHPIEEQRLRDAAYNLREAYAVYLGLVEYAYGGRPTQTTPAVTRTDGELQITTTLSEGLPEWWGHDRQRTLDSTIAVYVDGERVLATFDPATKTLVARVAVAPDARSDSPLRIRIHHANLYKHHNWPQRYAVTFDGAGAAASVTPLGGRYAGEDAED